jgi:hypothetical protein
MLESTVSTVIPLAGMWRFQLADQPERDIAVPSAWESSDPHHVIDGPAVYRHTVLLEATPPGARVLFEADAVSFACELFVNGHRAGANTGLWSRFQIDITQFVRVGDNALALRVWKPGARHPLRECVAGFLPDLGFTFGGIWQDCRLRVLRAAFKDLHVDAAVGALTFTFDAHGALGPAERARVEVWANGALLTHGEAADRGATTLNLASQALPVWQPGQANTLVRLDVLVRDTDGRVLAGAQRKVARREIAAAAGAFTINGQPAHLRGLLDWGWHPALGCPTPSADAVRAQFAQARALGFNLIKLCLFVPDDVTFDVADAEGMPLWLELPLWQPVVTAVSKRLALAEYDAILRRVAHHPSIVIVSLGCELDAAVDAGFLAALRAIARRWVPGALLCDNSGSSDAYDGSAAARGDFRDYHFYCDPHFFQPLIDGFRRVHQADEPWLFGEFCDADTLRDFGAAADAWWIAAPPTMPRDELDWLRDWRARLQRCGWHDGGARLTQLAREQATLTRKTVLETTRRNFAGGGYVLTGLRDTPITSSGVVDDSGALKFDAGVWRQFNAARVLTIDRAPRRAWTHGGDRPAPRDPSVFWSDEAVDVSILLSNGAEAVDGELRVRLGAVTRAARARARASRVSELARIDFDPPLRDIDAPAEVALEATFGDVRNRWPLLCVPRVNTAALAADVRVIDALTDRSLARVALGEHLVLWLRDPDRRFCEPCPFVREAIHVIDPALAPGVDLRGHYYGIATDFALDAAALSALCSATHCESHWQRIDARAMTARDYVLRVRIGQGTLIVSALRHAGGHGAQPVGLAQSPLGAWLLSRWAGEVSAAA